jgi:hypothetical protein
MPQLSQRTVFRIADNNMVHNFNFQQLTSTTQIARYPDVCI